MDSSIDLRGCEEGFVTTAEQLLQLFTDAKICPEPFEFRATRTIREILSTIPSFRDWRDSFDRDLFDDEVRYSRPRPLTSQQQANGVGRKYFGPVVVLVDALTYSSAEMFAAGIQVSRHWNCNGDRFADGWRRSVSVESADNFSVLRSGSVPAGGGSAFLSSRGAALPSRRKNSGRILEGAGVTPDVIYSRNQSDFYEKDRDLLETVGEILATNKNKRYSC